MTDEILFDRVGRLGLITLNRPKALNAFTHAMYLALEPVLDAWNADPAVKAVVIRGAGGKAFCAGGDVRALWQTGPGIQGPDDLKRRFFIDEYRVIRKVHRLSKPYVALIDGVTMGGGVGMSVNGAFRVATEHTVLAMPETVIGMIPDVGATRFLALCPGRIGLYLGLVGERLKAADLLHARLATHYVPAARLDELVGTLAAADAVEPVLERFAGDPGPASLPGRQAAIDRCFGLDSVPAIMAALETVGEPWAEAALGVLRRASPTALGLTFRQLRGQEAVTIEQSLGLEFALVQQLMGGRDFFEGVRAVLVDKDQSPHWRPASLAELDEAELDRRLAAARLDRTLAECEQ